MNSEYSEKECFKSQRTSQAFQTMSTGAYSLSSVRFQIPTDITGLSNTRRPRPPMIRNYVSNPNGHHRPFKRGRGRRGRRGNYCFKSQRTSQAFQTWMLYGTPPVLLKFQIPTDITGLSNMKAARENIGPCRFQIPTDITGLSNQSFLKASGLDTTVSNPNGHHRPFKHKGD